MFSAQIFFTNQFLKLRREQRMLYFSHSDLERAHVLSNDGGAVFLTAAAAPFVHVLTSLLSSPLLALKLLLALPLSCGCRLQNVIAQKNVISLLYLHKVNSGQLSKNQIHSIADR